jgi:hypothetical protein
VIDEIVDMFFLTPYPPGSDKCEKWAKQAFARIAALLNKYGMFPGTRVRVRLVAWTFRSSPRTLWNIWVDSHFAIEVTLPNGEIWYFDVGNWGGVFRPKDIPSYAE